MVTRLVLLLLALVSLSTAGPRSSRNKEIQLDGRNDLTEKLVVGEKLRLRCNSEANITWHKDGTILRSRPPLLKITRQAMKFKAVKHTDAGRYGCCIQLENGTEQCHNITLMVYNTIAHADFLQDVAAAHVQGMIEQREDLPTGGDSYNYEIDPVRQLNDADVMLRANLTSMSLVHELEEAPDSENTHVAGVYNETLPQMAPHFVKPNIMKHEVKKYAGSTVVLSCPAKGNPEPNITWTKDRNILSNHHYGQWSLRIEDTVLYDSGNYSCFICNVIGCINFTFEVDIIDHHLQKPNLTEIPQNSTVMVGHSVSFHCEGISGPSDVTWFQGYFTSHVDAKFRIHTDTPEILTLRNVTHEDAGWYTCVANNAFGITFASAYLRVVDIPDNLTPVSHLNDQEDSHDTETNRVAGEYNETVPQMPPRFTKPGNMNRMIAKPAGNMLRLKCPAEGNPEPNITWTKDGAPPYRHLYSIRNGRWSLILEDLVVSDSGNYTCIVCNLCGCINFTYKVDIIERYPHKPYVKEDYPRNVTARVNTTVMFNCPTYSDLEPHIQWIKMPHMFEEGTDPMEDNSTLLVQTGTL